MKIAQILALLRPSMAIVAWFFFLLKNNDSQNGQTHMKNFHKRNDEKGSYNLQQTKIPRVKCKNEKSSV